MATSVRTFMVSMDLGTYILVKDGLLDLCDKLREDGESHESDSVDDVIAQLEAQGRLLW